MSSSATVRKCCERYCFKFPSFYIRGKNPPWCVCAFELILYFRLFLLGKGSSHFQQGTSGAKNIAVRRFASLAETIGSRVNGNGAQVVAVFGSAGTLHSRYCQSRELGVKIINMWLFVHIFICYCC